MGCDDVHARRHAIIDCGAAVDCFGEVAAARTAQAIATAGDGRIPEDETDFFSNVEGDGNPIEASSAVSLSMTIGETHGSHHTLRQRQPPSFFDQKDNTEPGVWRSTRQFSLCCWQTWLRLL